MEVQGNSIMNKPPFTVSVEGNIGAGKSTMLKFFEQFADVELVPEPVAQWCDLRGHNLLRNKFEDPQRSINDLFKCYNVLLNMSPPAGGCFRSKVTCSSQGCSF